MPPSQTQPSIELEDFSRTPGSESSSSPPRARAALALVGVDARVARIYERLCRGGPQDAATVAEGLGVARGDVYRAFDQLMRRGLVALEPCSPARYRAADPTDAFIAAAHEEDARAAGMERACAAFVAALARAQSPDAPSRLPWSFRLVTGRQAVHVAARRMVRGAQTSILLAYDQPQSQVEKRAVDLLIGEAERRAQDIRLRIVPPRLRTSSPANAVDVDPPPTFLVVDGRECLFFTADEPSALRSREATWTNATAIVTMLQMLHEGLWAKAQL